MFWQIMVINDANLVKYYETDATHLGGRVLSKDFFNTPIRN